MQDKEQIRNLPDDDLLRHLAALLESSRRTEADLVAHIGEIDARRLYAREACPSMWAYCTERLHFSGAEAYLRIAAARAAREHPLILEMLADGRLHLSAIAMIAPHLTAANRDDLLRRVTHRSKRAIEELLAELAPRPDVQATIRKLPDRRACSGGVPMVTLPPSQRALSSLALSLEGGPPSGAPVTSGVVSGSDPVPASLPSGPGSASSPATFGESLRLDEVRSCGSAGMTAAPGVIEPLAPARYKVEFTASAVLKEKLERLQALMRTTVPNGDLARIIDAAVSEKLERLEARRFGKAKTPRKDLSATNVAPSSRHVPAAVRRSVDARDGGQCCYVDEMGRRCSARAWLELHHRHPFAVGGDHAPGNVSTVCRTHNRHLAEVDFGRKAMGKGRRSGVAQQPRLLLT